MGKCICPAARALNDAALVRALHIMRLHDVCAYELLGLTRGQDYQPADINTAYKKASRRAHPDKPGGDRERFEEIKEAYDVLHDDVHRAIYDLMHLHLVSHVPHRIPRPSTRMSGPSKR